MYYIWEVIFFYSTSQYFYLKTVTIVVNSQRYFQPPYIKIFEWIFNNPYQHRQPVCCTWYWNIPCFPPIFGIHGRSRRRENGGNASPHTQLLPPLKTWNHSSPTGYNFAEHRNRVIYDPHEILVAPTRSAGNGPAGIARTYLCFLSLPYALYK